jgi:hypothetical protein
MRCTRAILDIKIRLQRVEGIITGNNYIAYGDHANRRGGDSLSSGIPARQGARIGHS